MSFIPEAGELVSFFNMGPLTIHRSSSRTRNAYGGFTAAAPATSTIDPIAVTPVSGDARSTLPEAVRHTATHIAYTNVLLVATAPGNDGDVIEYEGYRHRVTAVEDRRTHGDGCIAYLEREERAV